MPTMPTSLPTTFSTFFKIKNHLFTPCLDELFNLWNNAVCQMSYLVCTAGRHIPTYIFEKVHKAFFNYYQFHAIADMSDEIILARMMSTLASEFERSLHHHDLGYESNNDYGLLPYITRPVCVYSKFSAEVFFNPVEYTTAQS